MITSRIHGLLRKLIESEYLPHLSPMHSNMTRERKLIHKNFILLLHFFIL